MKNLILTILALGGIIPSMVAQISSDILNHTKWLNESSQFTLSGVEFRHYISFSDSSLLNTAWLRAEKQETENSPLVFDRVSGEWSGTEKQETERPYYLSDTIPEEFDDTKVGTITKGCYLVTLRQWSNGQRAPRIYSIINFSDSVMTMEYPQKQTNVFRRQYDKKE